MLTLVMTVLTGLPGAQAGQGQAAQKKELFANESWYRDQKGEERGFVGVLRRVDRGKGIVGFGRFNPYRLEMAEKGKKDVREVYVGGKTELLAPYVGKRVRLTGKAVDMEVEGRRHREIWPARLEVLPAAGEKGKGTGAKSARAPAAAPALVSAQAGGEKGAAGKELKILAKGYWGGAGVRPDGPRQGHTFLVRSPEELPNHPPWNNLDAIPQVVQKQALAALTRALKVDKIDWAKQMVVVVTAGVKPTGGWKVEITKVTAGDKTVTVNYTVTPPSGFATQAFTHPGQVALVEHADGTPKFVMTPGKGGRPKLRPVPPAKSGALAVSFTPEQGAGEQKGKEDRELKVFARAPGRLKALRKGHAIARNPMELIRLMGGTFGGNIDKANTFAARTLKVEKIDWNKQMLIIISGGTQPTGGYSVELTGLKVNGDTLTVHWKLKTPRPGDIVTQALTSPALTLLVERYDSTVRFDPPAAKSGAGKGLDQ